MHFQANDLRGHPQQAAVFAASTAGNTGQETPSGVHVPPWIQDIQNQQYQQFLAHEQKKARMLQEFGQGVDRFGHNQQQTLTPQPLDQSDYAHMRTDQTHETQQQEQLVHGTSAPPFEHQQRPGLLTEMTDVPFFGHPEEEGRQFRIYQQIEHMLPEHRHRAQEDWNCLGQYTATPLKTQSSIFPAYGHPTLPGFPSTTGQGQHPYPQEEPHTPWQQPASAEVGQRLEMEQECTARELERASYPQVQVDGLLPSETGHPQSIEHLGVQTAPVSDVQACPRLDFIGMEEELEDRLDEQDKDDRSTCSDEINHTKPEARTWASFLDVTYVNDGGSEDAYSPSECWDIDTDDDMDSIYEPSGLEEYDEGYRIPGMVQHTYSDDESELDDEGKRRCELTNIGEIDSGILRLAKLTAEDIADLSVQDVYKHARLGDLNKLPMKPGYTCEGAVQKMQTADGDYHTYPVDFWRTSILTIIKTLDPARFITLHVRCGACWGVGIDICYYDSKVGDKNCAACSIRGKECEFRCRPEGGDVSRASSVTLAPPIDEEDECFMLGLA